MLKRKSPFKRISLYKIRPWRSVFYTYKVESSTYLWTEHWHKLHFCIKELKSITVSKLFINNVAAFPCISRNTYLPFVSQVPTSLFFCLMVLSNEKDGASYQSIGLLKAERRRDFFAISACTKYCHAWEPFKESAPGIVLMLVTGIYANSSPQLRLQLFFTSLNHWRWDLI